MGARSAQSMISEYDEVARLVQSAAVLMSAGLSPDRVWTYLGVSLAQVRGRPEPSWRSFTSGWAVATTVGAPMAQSMRRLAMALREGAEVVREIQAALVGPTSASKLILFLPVVALGLGVLLGFNSLEILMFRPLGWACVVISAFLIYSGAKWSKKLTDRATPLSWNPGLRAELTAMALGGGASLERAVSLVSAELGESSSLGVQLLLPLGICVLPAFVLVGVVPLIVSVLSSTTFGF